MYVIYVYNTYIPEARAPRAARACSALRAPLGARGARSASFGYICIIHIYDIHVCIIRRAFGALRTALFLPAPPVRL